ncbi:MAG: YqhA family protein [Cyanobacteria bacterium]|nr:YqhA family protein [Cyanobacteriota bacterium]
MLAIVPVEMSLLSAAAAFLYGSREVLGVLRVLLDGSGDKIYLFAKQIGQLVGGVDLYLIGIALLIFGFGVYELLISNIEAAHEDGKGTGSSLLDIRSLDDLKEKLVKVIVVALIVAAFKVMLIFPITSTTNLLVFSGSVFLLALSAWLVAVGKSSSHS